MIFMWEQWEQEEKSRGGGGGDKKKESKGKEGEEERKGEWRRREASAEKNGKSKPPSGDHMWKLFRIKIILLALLLYTATGVLKGSDESALLSSCPGTLLFNVLLLVA